MSRVPAPRSGADDTAVRLREDFDAGFLRPVVSARAQVENLLAVRVGREPYALRLDDLAGLVPGLPFTALPTGSAAALGVAAHRGVVLAGHDLRLLFRTSDDPPADRRWTALAAVDRTVGLVFDGLEGHLRVPLEDLEQIRPAEAAGNEPAGLTRAVLRGHGPARPVIDVPLVVRAIRAPGGAAEPGGSGGAWLEDGRSAGR